MGQPVILLVEDEVDLLQVTAEAVRRSLPGYTVLEATGADEARRVLGDADGPLALAVVDHVLGGTPGLGLLEHLREQHPHTSLMMFTGRASPAVEERARAHGVHVTWKPVRLQQLLGEMTELLEGRAAAS